MSPFVKGRATSRRKLLNLTYGFVKMKRREFAVSQGVNSLSRCLFSTHLYCSLIENRRLIACAGQGSISCWLLGLDSASLSSFWDQTRPLLSLPVWRILVSQRQVSARLPVQPLLQVLNSSQATDQCLDHSCRIAIVRLHHQQSCQHSLGMNRDRLPLRWSHSLVRQRPSWSYMTHCSCQVAHCCWRACPILVFCSIGHQSRISSTASWD